jgi:hypothetical protein
VKDPLPSVALRLTTLAPPAAGSPLGSLIGRIRQALQGPQAAAAPTA